MPEIARALTVDDLVAGYFAEADIVRGCSLRINPGELLGVIGPNGAGKSTLLKAIFGLVPIRSGRVGLGDREVTGLLPHKLVERGIGYVPQLRNVFTSLTVEENLRMGLFLRRKQWRERFSHVARAFPLVQERKRQLAGLLSGGQRKIVATARALMMEPSVLLLDEPSAGLAPVVQSEIFSSVRRIADNGVAVLMVEQNVRRCLQLCDRAIVLDQGRNAFEGSGHELLQNPDVVSLYVGSMPRALRRVAGRNGEQAEPSGTRRRASAE
jgi:branched-chain amino acid transport system ATP-binding protein